MYILLEYPLRWFYTGVENEMHAKIAFIYYYYYFLITTSSSKRNPLLHDWFSMRQQSDI